MIFIISMDFKRIIREAVEGEEDKKNLLDAVLGKILAIYSPIPKSPYSCWRVIRNIFESEGYDRYDIGVDVNLNASSNNASEGNKFKIKDRIRFFEFFKTLSKEDDVRGFVMEGFLAGIFKNGVYMEGKSHGKSDITINGKRYSVKSKIDKDDRYSLGSLGKINSSDREVHNCKEKTTIECLADMGEEERNGKIKDIYKDIDNWLFLKWDTSKEEIIYRVVSNDNMVKWMSDSISGEKPRLGKSGGGKSLGIKWDELVKDKLVGENKSKSIIFPKSKDFPKKELEKYIYDKDRGLGKDKIYSLFGPKYSEKIRYDVIRSIQRDPDSFIKRIIKWNPERVRNLLNNMQNSGELPQ